MYIRTYVVDRIHQCKHATHYTHTTQPRLSAPGVITDCNSPDFNGVDGILGFGLPKAGSDLPTPVLFAMTDEENKDTNGYTPSPSPPPLHFYLSTAPLYGCESDFSESV